MSVPWIKLTTNIFDDEKIKLIDSMPEHDAILVIWIKLLTLAGKCNSKGCLMISESMPYTDEMLAAIFNRPVNLIRLSLEAFERLGMVERHSAIVLVNWEKHQNEAAFETIRENERKRKQLQRAAQKQLIGSVPDMSRTESGHVPEKSQNVRILDKDIDKDIEKDREEPASAPSLQSDGTSRFEKAKASWNTLGLKPAMRKTLLDVYADDRSAILSTFKNYSDDEIAKAMYNYAEILESDRHEVTAPYQSLCGFLKSGVEKFGDDANPWERFAVRGAKPEPERWVEPRCPKCNKVLIDGDCHNVNCEMSPR